MKMMNKLTKKLDDVAERLEKTGHLREAYEVDKVSNEIDAVLDPTYRGEHDPRSPHYDPSSEWAQLKIDNVAVYLWAYENPENKEKGDYEGWVSLRRDPAEPYLKEEGLDTIKLAHEIAKDLKNNTTKIAQKVTQGIGLLNEGTYKGAELRLVLELANQAEDTVVLAKPMPITIGTTQQEVSAWINAIRPVDLAQQLDGVARKYEVDVEPPEHERPDYGDR